MIDPELIVSCATNSGCSTIHAVVMSLIVFVVLLLGFAYATLLERRLVAWFQHRVGPNRVGPKGLIQPIADGIKLMFKEDVLPSQADKVLYTLAPAIKAIPVLILLAVVPLAPPILVPWFDGKWYEVALGIGDVNVGVLWLLAITSIGTYGLVLAGWASGSKYSMLGGLRSSAQMISYELSMGLTAVVPIMLAGSMSVGDIMDAQATPPILGWFVFQNPLAAIVFMIALIAEVSRSPFDMPEAESELVGGYNTEYSGMKFALLFAGEYIGMIGVSAIAAAMFFGGYHWPLPVWDAAPLLGVVNMTLKIVLFISGLLWVRATLPRIRYDRLMAFGWKVMLPLALLSVAWSAFALVLGDLSADPNVYLMISGAFFLAVAVLGALWLAVRAARQRRPADLTDSRSGLGWVLVQVVGGLVAAPFALYDWAMGQRRSLSEFVGDIRRREVGTTAVRPETPAEPVEGGQR